MQDYAKLLASLFPELKIKPSLRKKWEQEEYRQFFKIASIGLFIWAIGQIVHHYALDRQLGLEPISLWFTYRYAMAGLALAALAAMITLNKYDKKKYVKPVYILWSLVQSYYQAKNMYWSDLTPWIFTITIPLIFVSLSRLSSFKSAICLAASYLIGIQFWDLQKSNYMILSGAIVAIALIFVIRSKLSSEIDLFLIKEEKFRTQEALIKSQIQTADQIKAFLPKVIYNRFSSLKTNKGLDTEEAMKRVISITQKMVVCTYSDIRSYTQLSKRSILILEKRIIPEIKSSIDIIENYQGIPRIVGDLVFAYYDSKVETSILRALLANFEVHFQNQKMNNQGSEIKRHFIVSAGEVLVGNIGGDHNSREITVMGSAANVLSRIDQITKKKRFKETATTEYMIITEQVYLLLNEIVPHVQILKIDLKELNLEIKDYPEMDVVYCLKMDSGNYSTIKNIYNQTINPTGDMICRKKAA